MIPVNMTVYGIEIPYNGTIQKWTMICNADVGASGIVVDVWKIPYTADTLPAVGNTMCSQGTKPLIPAGAHKTGQENWDCTGTTITAGDILAFSVTTAPTAATWCSLTLEIKR